MAAGVKKLSKTFVWILMGMLIVGLAGFGAVNFSGSATSVATVGDEEISVQTYARQLQQEQRAIEAQTGQAMPMSQMTALGLDRNVLARMITMASIDNEVARLGLSIGDENLLKEIVDVDAFKNVSGEFDRETYRFALDRAGLSEKAFEADIRKETARTLVQGAIMSGVRMPSTLQETITGYIGARRSFTWVPLTTGDTAMIALAPTEAELQAFYDANPALFTLPETKQITYALLSPEMVMDEVEVEDEAVRQLYDSRASQYQVPERVLVERLVFSDEETAADALAQLEVGGTTFETLVADRDLALADIDMGDVTRADLGAAAEAAFGAEIGSVVGPLPSDLGPALFRINGKLEARTTSFEDAEAELRDELAAARARRVIEAQAEQIDDLLAGGATLEELTTEAGMDVATLSWTAQSEEAIAAYSAFRTAAAAVTAEDFPAVEFLEDGSLFAIRLDEVLPERPEPLADAQDKALQGWNAEQRLKALRTQAESILARAQANGTFDEALKARVETGLTRTAYIDHTPADMMNQVFEMEPGELRIVADEDSTVILRLDELLPPEANEELEALSQALGAQLDQALAQALFQAFAQDAQIRARPQVDQQALNAVLANFQ